MTYDWIKWDRWGVRVERLHATAGPFTYFSWQVTSGRWQFNTSDGGFSRHVAGNAWEAVGPQMRCVFCQRLTWGCPEHWFCGVCRGCQKWDRVSEDSEPAA